MCLFVTAAAVHGCSSFIAVFLLETTEEGEGGRGVTREA